MHEHNINKDKYSKTHILTKNTKLKTWCGHFLCHAARKWIIIIIIVVHRQQWSVVTTRHAHDQELLTTRL